MMKKFVSVVFAAVLAITIAVGAYANDGVNAYSIASYENGEVTFENYGGVNEQSVFELASNGKAVAAYIALSLAEEGELGLDETVAPYLGADLLTDDTRMRDITLRQLLSHTAGFSPSFELGVDKKIYTDPGVAFRYSGVGYIYLQSVLEGASGMTLEQAAERYVFGPLGMANSTFEGAKTVTPHMKLSSAVPYALLVFVVVFIVLLPIVSIIGKLTGFRLYSFRAGWLLCAAVAVLANIAFLLVFMSKVTFVFVGFLIALGLTLWLTRKNKKLFYAGLPALTVLVLILGLAVPARIPVANEMIAKEANAAYTLKSTSEDMARFCGELLKRCNGGDKTVNEMFSPAAVIDEANSWGLGIAIETLGDTPTYWHSGINPGFQSLLVIEPRREKYIVILTNSDGGLLLAKDAAREYLGVKGVWEIPR